MRVILGAALGAALFLCVRGGASFCDAPGWTRVFADDFDGSSLDPASWSVLNNTAENDSSCRDAMCLASNVAVAGGNLVLTSRRESVGWASYSTGAVNSQAKRYWADAPTFRACVSAKLPGGDGHGQGLWPAIWMMPNDDSCWPDHGEMDVMEMINGNPTIYASYHYTNGTAKCKGAASGNTQGHQVIPSFATVFHEYSVERSGDYYAYIYDGSVIFNSTGTAAKLTQTSWYLILNLAVGGPWPGPPSATTVFPNEMLVDYVRVSTA